MKSGNLTQDFFLAPKVEFIKKYNPTPCYHCDGIGYLTGPGIRRRKALRNPCKVCKGTGEWVEDTFDLIATQPDGQKIAFRVDGIK